MHTRTHWQQHGYAVVQCSVYNLVVWETSVYRFPLVSIAEDEPESQIIGAISVKDEHYRDDQIPFHFSLAWDQTKLRAVRPRARKVRLWMMTEVRLQCFHLDRRACFTERATLWALGSGASHFLLSRGKSDLPFLRAVSREPFQMGRRWDCAEPLRGSDVFSLHHYKTSSHFTRKQRIAAFLFPTNSENADIQALDNGVFPHQAAMSGVLLVRVLLVSYLIL